MSIASNNDQADGTKPVSIVTGFLGAGKTTLINRLLHDPDQERLGVLVNDFGALNIDSKLIMLQSENQISLNNGCVCCSIQDDLAGGLITLAKAQPGLTRIIVECSGVSHPSGVLAVFDNDAVSDVARVDGVFCLIDAQAFDELDFKDTELAIDQAAMSDLVLLNKIDTATEPSLCRIERTLRGAQPHIRIDRVAHAAVPSAVLFGAQHLRAQNDRTSVAASDHENDYCTAGLSWDKPLQFDEFQAFCGALPSGLLRAKGVLRFRMPNESEDKRAVFQQVGKRSSLTFDTMKPPAVSEFVLITRRPLNIGQALQAASKHCPGFRRAHRLRRTGDGRALFLCD